MALSAAEIKDLVTTTQRELGKLKWTSIAADLQDYIAMGKILQKERVKFDSGQGIQWNVQVNWNDQAKNVGLMAVDDPNISDTMTTASAPWRHSVWNWGFDRREIAMNRDPAKIVDLVQTRRVASTSSAARLMEQNFWGKPDDSTDELTPFGIDYWVVPNSSEGFNGGNPNGFSSGAGNLDSSTYSNWANWTARYAAVSKTDLIRKWRKAATFTEFHAPVEHADYNKGNRYGYYCNYNVLGTMEEMLEAQNDNLGSDVASQDGRVKFRRIPVTWVPYLENHTLQGGEQDPVYGINWGVFHPVFLKGEYMAEEAPEKASNQHTVYVVYVDLTYNFICQDRRRLFVLSKSP